VPVGYMDPKYTMEIPAILTMTNYQLIVVKKSLQQHSTSAVSLPRNGFVSPVSSPLSSPRTRERPEVFNIPLATIARVEKLVTRKEKYLDITCKDFRFVKLSFIAQTGVRIYVGVLW
jgi:hypothetical protein